MIGAPSDIKNEVGIVREVVNKWNDLYSEKEKIVLLPKHWATSTYPTAGARPQESINKQIVEKSDLLISILETEGQFLSHTSEQSSSPVS